MAALTTFAELMARASATVFSQLYSNALEKAQQQHQLNIQSQQQTIAPFPIIPALMASVSIPTGMPCISPISQQQQVIITTNENKVKEEKRLVEQENGNCSNKINRKRKRSKNNNNNETKTTIQQTIKVEEKTTQQQQQQIKQEQCCSNNSSPSLANTSRISSPDSTTVHKGRKLKLYAAEEKTDIIDYAKCIGNRAAGREFNVAESSIREWRKNEDKIRKQAETTAGCTQHFEKNQKEILTRIDDELVKMLNSKDKRCTTWYGIAEQVNSLWENIAKELSIENSQMKITMGWVSRFMRRNEQRVPKVTPLLLQHHILI
ncbi:hypothetical protein Mgra_00004924 [Meloidogyne graminicola]|uniref:HTH CENPB-type domain-containing protein n=1 Tax=Meloidogyne graminicola TaxID=189291 RepID=A0A8S9ZR23_9BILA|nr:hypothetical protein Mgra_00004924 [Meloidogyne graminicola]